MDLVRSILLTVEEHEHGRAPRKVEIEGYSDEQIGYHVWLTGEAGLLYVAESTHMGSPSPVAIPISMTWEGYEFLGAARQLATWEGAKEKISKAGAGLTFEILKAVLVAISKGALGLS
jgi:hypothetical protein